MSTLALLLLAGGMGAQPSVATCPETLVGVWYVLVHYRDLEGPHPNEFRWTDRVLEIATLGEELQLTDHPFPVFERDDGRFHGDTGKRQRSKGAWEPNDSQLAEIERGVRVSRRIAKTKKLRRRDEGLWVSESPASSGTLFLDYEERWSVASKGGACVLKRRDILGSGTDSLEGAFEFSVERIRSDGWLEGTYQRDGRLRGSFQMIPSGKPRLREPDELPKRGRGTSPY